MIVLSKLYLIPFLHQTTTWSFVLCSSQWLYLIPFLHQTTTDGGNNVFPQSVVSYSISTSNHNLSIFKIYLLIVVSYSISTSNHNSKYEMVAKKAVVSYSISTSNHNDIALRRGFIGLYLIPFLHQTTTITRLL